MWSCASRNKNLLLCIGEHGAEKDNGISSMLIFCLVSISSPSFHSCSLPFRNLIILSWSRLLVSLVLCDHNVNESRSEWGKQYSIFTIEISTVKFKEGKERNSNRIAETLREMTMFLFVKIFSPLRLVVFLSSFRYPRQKFEILERFRYDKLFQ